MYAEKPKQDPEPTLLQLICEDLATTLVSICDEQHIALSHWACLKVVFYENKIKYLKKELNWHTLIHGGL